MSTSQLLTIGYVSVSCLSPFVLYICWLSAVNRRDKPTMLAGTWDFAALLVGLSGMILLGGVLLLTIVQSDSRFLARGSFEQVREGWERGRLYWSLVVVGYLSLVMLGIWVNLRHRLRMLCIYNIHANDAIQSIEAALKKSQLEANRHGNAWYFSGGSVQMSLFSIFSNVSFQFSTKVPKLQEEIERHLQEEVSRLHSAENVAAPWITSFATSMVLILLGLIGLTLYVMYFR